MDAIDCRGSVTNVLDWGVAGRCMPGEAVSGDLYVVRPFPGGALVGVIDGLGHGADAEVSARTALEALGSAPGQALDLLVSHCHRSLNRLRGVVMSLASFDAERGNMTWVGVGNVEGVLIRADPHSRQKTLERLLVVGGVVGQAFPKLRPTTLPVSFGDTLVLATDGLRSAFADDLRTEAPVQVTASRILAKHARGADDALVLTARYRGDAP